MTKRDYYRIKVIDHPVLRCPNCGSSRTGKAHTVNNNFMNNTIERYFKCGNCNNPFKTKEKMTDNND